MVVVAVLAMAVALAIAPATALADTPDTSSNTTTDTASGPADYDNWSAIATAISDQLDQGMTTYRDGDRASAASTISAAYNVTYVASNMTAAVRDTLGSDRQQSQAEQFQSIQQLTYTDGHADDLATQITALDADLTDAAAQLDAADTLANPRDYAAARSAQTEAERQQLQAEKKTTYTGKGDRTWTDVAEDIGAVLDEAVAAARSGDARGGSDKVNEAYYQYYERLGFEKNVMNAIGGDRVSLVESRFKEARKAMIAEDAIDGIAAQVDELKAMIVEDGGALDGGAADNVNGFTRFVTSSVGQAFLVLIREGLEALLIVAAIIAYLIKSGNRRFVKWIYLGVAAGLAGSGVVAALFVMLFGGSGPVQEIMEGVCALIAMGMLLWTSNWMLSKSSVAAWNQYIRTKTEAAVADAAAVTDRNGTLAVRTMASLALLSFLAVFREGAETVIFYESIYTMSRDVQGMWIGGLAAAVVLVIVFLIIRFTSVRIPVGPFFLVTSILMSALVVVFAGGGVHSLIEGDLLGGIYLSGVPTNDWLGLYPYVETLIAQALAALAVVALFVVGWRRQRKARTTVAT